MSDLHNRRTFLRAAAAANAAWLVADLVQVEEALAWAEHQAGHQAGNQHAKPAPQTLIVLTRAQADVIDAVTARILPSVDGRPGAHEAGAVYFIDRSLSTFNAAQKALYADGVLDLNRRAAQKVAGTASFAALTTAQQDELLHDVEQTPFFQATRFDAIVGTFALPSWGGNRDHVGWRMIGLEHQPFFQAPFGFYDAEANRSAR